MTKPRSREDILSKVAKAFALSQDKGATEGEAMAAVAAVQKLLARHNLAMADVQDFQQAQSEKDEARGVGADWEAVKSEIVKPRQHFAQFESWLQLAVQNLCNVSAIHTRSYDYDRDRRLVRLIFIGEKRDVAIASAIYLELVKTCKRLARKLCGRSRWTPKHRSFAEGFASKVEERSQAIGAGTDDFTDGEKEQYAVVLHSKQGWLQQMLAELVPDLKEGEKKAQRGKLDLDAYVHGQAQGAMAQLGTNGLGQ
jgi:hypothetical protein